MCVCVCKKRRVCGRVTRSLAEDKRMAGGALLELIFSIEQHTHTHTQNTHKKFSGYDADDDDGDSDSAWLGQSL